MDARSGFPGERNLRHARRMHNGKKWSNSFRNSAVITESGMHVRSESLESISRDAESGAAIASESNIAELIATPGFADAARLIASQLIEDYLADRVLNRVFNDRGRYLAGLIALYLHRVPLDGEEDAGITVGRMKTLCIRTGVSSPGRAVAILSIMRFGGYLKPSESSQDRRRTLLVPTERFIALQERRWRFLFGAMVQVMPEARRALELYMRPDFQAAFLSCGFDTYMAGFRFVYSAPELTPYFEHLSGFHILLQLLAKAGGKAGPVPLTISDLGSQFWVSRAHVRKVLTLATTDGFIARTTGSRDPIIVQPALAEVMSRFFAGTFLFARHCIRHAIDAIEAPTP